MLDVYGELRENMVREQLLERGIREQRVLDAFRQVPREEFVPPELAGQAYDDGPLPIGGDQTISQPYIVGLTLASLSLQGSERVLDIGTGSGYAAAVLSRLAREVYTVERIEALAKSSAERLARLGYSNLHVLHGDGSLGWPRYAPYDAIAVAASAPGIPDALLSQLGVAGRLVMPVGPEEGEQVLLRVTRESGTKFREEVLCGVRFVPLIGAQGWGSALPGRILRSYLPAQ